jgi:hypothetical protein
MLIFNLGALLDQYARAPGLIGPSYEAQESLNERLALVGEVGPEAETAIGGYAGQIEAAKSPVVTLTTESGELGDQLERLARTWNINVVTTYSQVGTPPGQTTGAVGGMGGQMQMGGVVPGRIGQAIPIIAHGGEVILNPYQYGAMGGPGGPPPPPNVSYGGDTINIFNPLAAKMYMDQKRQKRLTLLRGAM